MRTVALNQQDVSVRIRILDDTDGTPATGINDATAGQEIWYQRGENTAAVTDGGSAADLAGVTSVHSDWGFIEIREGWYRVDFPDACFLEGVGSVLCGINATGFTGVTVTVKIEPLFKYQGTLDSATSTTSTFPAGASVAAGDTIHVVEGTGISQTRLVTSVTNDVATHAAWDVNVSTSTSTLLLIAGDATIGQGGSNADVAASQLQSDISDVNALLPTQKSADGYMISDVRAVLDDQLTGDGSAGNPWGPSS